MDADFLKKLGLKAADKYLEEKTPLNDTIIKMASEHSLNKNQVHCVCVEANHKVLAELVKTAESRDVEFPLADCDIVKKDGTLYEKNEVVKEKTASFDFNKLASVKTKLADEIFPGTKIEVMTEKVATKLEAYTIDSLGNMLTKLNNAKAELMDKEAEFSVKDKELKSDLSGMIRDMMNDGHSFSDLYKAAVVANPKEAEKISQLFEEAGKNLNLEERGVKTAGLHERISLQKARAFHMLKTAANVQPFKHDIKYVKDQHTLVKHINTIFQNAEYRLKNSQTINYADDLVKQVKSIGRDKMAVNVIENKEK